MDLSDWKAAFIKLAKGVTIDEVALVGASIHPISVEGSIMQARTGGFDNWQTAELIARLLRDAVLNDELIVKEAYVSSIELYGVREVVPGNKLQDHLRANGFPAVQGAKFHGREVWEWMAYHGFIDPKYAEPLRSPGTDRIIRAMNAADKEKEQSAQVAELKSQLEQAHKELARIKSEQEKANRSEVLHNTELLKLVHVVQERYWGANWDPSNNQTNTIQPVIIEWLMSTYSLSGFRAKAVEAVACPIDRNPVKKP